MKVLNLYAGVGGNRKLWPEWVKVTAVEYDPQIAVAYADMHPEDTTRRYNRCWGCSRIPA